MKKRRTTLADIARKAGVHTTTVSLALRNNPRLPEATRVRLQNLAREMGYSPDPWVSALVAYRSQIRPPRNPPTLAYITGWNTRWGWKELAAHPDFYRGAEAKAAELGYVLEHFWMQEPGLSQQRLGQIFDARGITGLIIASQRRDFDTPLLFDWSRLAAVRIDYFPHEPRLPVITNDQMQIIRLAMVTLIARGYRRIGFVMEDGWDIAVDRHWSAGFLCEQQALLPDERISAYLFPNEEPLEDWLRRTRPEVVIGKEVWLQPTFEAMKLRIPEDIAFVDVFLEDTTGKTAGVRQNSRAVGALAVELLAGQLTHNKFGVPEFPTRTFVEGSWIDGASLPDRRACRSTADPAIPAPSIPN